jgi:hypothetical protein
MNLAIITIQVATPHFAQCLEDALEIGRRRETQGSISGQEGQPIFVDPSFSDDAAVIGPV